MTLVARAQCCPIRKSRTRRHLKLSKISSTNMLSTVETTASKILSALDYQNKGAVPWRESVVSRRCTPRFQLGDRLLCVRFRISEEHVRQGERQKGRERDISAETPYMSLPSIHPDRQHSSLHVNLKVAIVSFMRYELAFVGTKYMAFAHGY